MEATRVNRPTELTFGCEIARGSCHDTEDDAAPGSDESRRGSGGDEPGDAPRTPTDHGPFPCESPIQDHPGRGGKHRGQVGIPARHDSSQVCTKRRTAVETKPSEPQEYGPERDQRHVVRAEVQHHPLLPTSENHGVGQRRETRTDFDGPAASVIEDTILESPAVEIPHPACEGTIDQRRPKEDEHHHRYQAPPFGDRAHHDRGCDGTKLHLERVRIPDRLRGRMDEYLIKAIQQFRDERRARTRGTERFPETKFLQVPDKTVRLGGRKGKGITPEVPLKCHDGERAHTSPDHAESRLPSGQPRVEEA